MSYLDRLAGLRAMMKNCQIDCYIVPHSDEYQSEFLPPHSERLAWLTGFNGSAGIAFILLDKAYLFVDGRYDIQVKKQVDAKSYEFRKLGINSPYLSIFKELMASMKIGYDPRLHLLDDIDKIRKLSESHSLHLVEIQHNLIDRLWSDKPPRSKNKIYQHNQVFSGVSYVDKVKKLSQELLYNNYEGYLVSSPDTLCWLYNLRGNDTPFTPLILAYAIVLPQEDKSIIFIDLDRLEKDVYNLYSDYVEFVDEREFDNYLDSLNLRINSIAVDKNSASEWVCKKIQLKGIEIIKIDDPCAIAKSCKNTTEQNGMRVAHERDGAALIKFLCWFDEEKDFNEITELNIVEKLNFFRAQGEHYMGPSFSTISAYAGNGAIIHYTPSKESNRLVSGDSLLLIDSGGQYLDGTTDVTRTIAVGKISAEQKLRFTQVLRGHIALAGIKFPSRTKGGQLDVLARSYLWQDNLDYDHGTGHGVGSFLGVHQGVQRIGKGFLGAELNEGMVLSNEPGYYKENSYGIRIENLILVKLSGSINSKEKSKMYEFETLTLVPIDKKLIDISILSQSEINWINKYHEEVFKRISKYLGPKEKNWLIKATSKL